MPQEYDCKPVPAIGTGGTAGTSDPAQRAALNRALPVAFPRQPALRFAALAVPVPAANIVAVAAMAPVHCPHHEWDGDAERHAQRRRLGGGGGQDECERKRQLHGGRPYWFASQHGRAKRRGKRRLRKIISLEPNAGVTKYSIICLMRILSLFHGSEGTGFPAHA